MKVANKKYIRRLALCNMKASRTRNIVAVVAIVLTSVLFTSLFTIMMSVINGFEEASFRQIGTYSHGAFVRLYEGQYKALKDAPEFDAYGTRMLLGTEEEKPFNKISLEISYCDENAAKWMYLLPTEGNLPEEGTRQAAADKKVLELLGIEPEIGKEFTVAFHVNGREVTRTYLLSGFWDADRLAPANHILVPQSEVSELVRDNPPDVRLGHYGGCYDLYFMLDNSRHIERTEKKILEERGYQNEDRNKDTYIKAEINLGYVSAHRNQSDMETIALIFGLVLLIILTGYLVIHNIFCISTASEIPRYGLLKTVGTTKRQIRKIVYMEAFMLAGIGIPIGLALGYGVGIILTPLVTKQLNDITVLVSASPVIFILTVVFALITVLLSGMKPARLAARVSPIEALGYTEHNTGSLKKRQKSKRVSEYRMACRNIGRNKRKAVITIISLTMAVMVFNITFVITNSFDMDKYLSDVKADYMLGSANYFRASGHLFSEEHAVGADTIDEIKATGMVREGGCTYGIGSEQYIYQYVPKERFLASFPPEYYSQETIDYFLEHTTQIDGRYEDGLNLYGMDAFCLDTVNVIEGDLSELMEGDNYIAAVYQTDDYGNVEEDSNWVKVGDTVTLRYAESVEYYNPDTGRIYTEEELDVLTGDEPCWDRAVEYHDVTYTVCAVITLSNKMSYRYFSRDEFVLSTDVLLENYPNAGVMYYAYNVDEADEEKMEAFISDYTINQMPEYDYESRLKWEKDLNSYRQMFLILGSVLSAVIGIIGIINFINVNLTGISVRKHEFTLLQSVGMTGKQLKKMLVTEGMVYALGSLFLALLLSAATASSMERGVEHMFWFCAYQNTVLPIICLFPVFALIGIVIPLIVYRSAMKKSLVDRLRESVL